MPSAHCPHCGRLATVSLADLTAEHECSGCGSLFTPLPRRAPPVPTPATPAREEEDDGPDSHPAGRRRGHGFTCPFCRSEWPPAVRKEITLAGWYLFVALLGSVCLAWLCWLPLVTLRREYRHCSSCGIRLD